MDISGVLLLVQEQQHQLWQLQLLAIK